MSIGREAETWTVKHLNVKNISEENVHFWTTYNFTSSWLAACSWRTFIHQSEFCVYTNSNQCLSFPLPARRPCFHWRILRDCLPSICWATLFNIFSPTVTLLYLIQNKITDHNPNRFYNCSSFSWVCNLFDAWEFLKQYLVSHSHYWYKYLDWQLSGEAGRQDFTTLALSQVFHHVRGFAWPVKLVNCCCAMKKWKIRTAVIRTAMLAMHGFSGTRETMFS